VGCASRTMQHAGFSGFIRLCVHDVGCRKGESPPTSERIARVVQEAARLLSSDNV
jgi:uncharacterized metal-binding protein